MGSFTAELRVAGYVIPLIRCRYGVHQGTGQRGRASEKVRYEPFEGWAVVPHHQFLENWTANPTQRHEAWVVLSDDRGQAWESVHLKAAYSVHYDESFRAGDVGDGAYTCYFRLSDPDGYEIIQGGPPASAFIQPAPGTHGTPRPLSNVAPVAAVAAAPPSDVPPHLPAPQPQPSPDHKQVHLTQAEWQALTAGRWDADNNKKFLKRHHNTEFHVAGDPFVYRVDGKGKVVAVYDEQKSYNVTGTRKNLKGIPLTTTGEPTYAGTPHLYPVSAGQKNVVEIEMAGNRPGDFKKANEAAGLAGVVKAQGLDADEAPDGYVWHHRDDFKPKSPPNPPWGICTMELVKVQAHRDTFVHYGSCDQCNKHFNQRLYR